VLTVPLGKKGEQFKHPDLFGDSEMGKHPKGIPPRNLLRRRASGYFYTVRKIYRTYAPSHNPVEAKALTVPAPPTIIENGF